MKEVWFELLDFLERNSTQKVSVVIVCSLLAFVISLCFIQLKNSYQEYQKQEKQTLHCDTKKD